MTLLARSRLALTQVLGFTGYCFRRFMADRCPQIAGSLSYSTLLATVPLLAIAFAVLSRIPQVQGLYEDVLTFAMDNILPDAGLEISEQVSLLLANAQKVTGAGILALVITAYLLLVTLNAAFSGIWRSAPSRNLLRRLLLQWVIVTLWPVAVALSLSLSSYGFAVLNWFGVDRSSHLFGLTEVFPFVLALLAFACLYVVVAPRRLSWSHALVGAAVAACLFELLKRGFGIYIGYFPSYEAIYGALATIPILLVWVFLAWAVILFGAEVAAALPEWRDRQATVSGIEPAGARLATALTLLARLSSAQTPRDGLPERDLAEALPARPVLLAGVMGDLRRSRFVEVKKSRWVLRRTLDMIVLDDLLAALGLDWKVEPVWPPPAGPVVAALAQQTEGLGRRSLEDLLSPAVGQPAQTPA